MFNEYEIPDGWIVRKIEDVGEVISGGTPSTSIKEYWDGSILWITPADLSGYKKKVILNGRKNISEDGLKKSSARLFPKGSVLFSSRAPIGYVAIAGTEMATNQGFKTVIPHHVITSDYLYYFLKGSKQKAEDEASGTTFKEISLKKFSALEIPLPPLAEQHRIVAKIEELFSSLDKAIESINTAKEQLKVYRQAVLKWAFEGRFTNNNVKDGELPQGWEWKKISDLCNVVRGGSPRPAGDERYYNGSIPFLKVADLTNDERIYLTSYTFTIKEAGLKKTRQIEPNTLLLTNSGATLGVPKITKIAATMNDGIAAFLGLDEQSLFYVYYFWVSKTKELRTINQGAAQPNLNTEIIKNYVIPICSFKEQAEIVKEIESRLSVCEKIEEGIENSLLQAEALRQSILKKAFEGKLVPQDPNDEPASKLTERIKAERAKSEQIKKRK